VAVGVDLDLQRYIERKKGARDAQTREGAAYAYSGDLRVKNTLFSLRPVTMAVEATGRLWKSVARAELLEHAVQVSPEQLPRVDALIEQAARTLHIPRPAVYVSSRLPDSKDGSMTHAHTLGTDDDPYVVLDERAVLSLNDSELLFVLGQECGHIQNNHVVFTTAIYYLAHAANRFLKWIVTPATLALSAWARRAEITCDRAGVICVRNLDTAAAVLLKRGLKEPVDIETLLAPKRTSSTTNGVPHAESEPRNVEETSATAAPADDLDEKLGALLRDHPQLQKRILALRLFAESNYYKGLLGEPGGLTQAEVDGKVGEVLSR
jgi:Zn-dependent protease with chaperone function